LYGRPFASTFEPDTALIATSFQFSGSTPTCGIRIRIWLCAVFAGHAASTADEANGRVSPSPLVTMSAPVAVARLTLTPAALTLNR
jgi:hypothetical protein